MAYFPNGSAGDCLHEQCGRCRYGQEPCPIYLVQLSYNYDACNNEVASAILMALIKNDGTCSMFELDKEWFGSDPAWKPNAAPDTTRQMLDSLPLPRLPQS